MRAIRPLKLAALAATTATAGVLFVSPAAAAPAPPTTSTIVVPVAAVTPLVGQYNQGPTFTITLNATVVVQGGVLRFSISGNVPGRQFTITVPGTSISPLVLTADANGVVSGSIDTSLLGVGQYRLQVVATNTGETASAAFTIIAAQASVIPAGGGTSASGSSGGGLAFTGASAVVPLTTLGAVLVLGGGAAVIAGRRRRQDDAA